MRKKYRTGLKLVGMLLVLSLLVLCSYQKYLHEIEIYSPIVIVEDGLSINFLKGNTINLNDSDKTYTFSITNNSSTEISYYIYLKDLETNNSLIKYDLIEKNNKTNILKNELIITDTNLANMIKIEPGETHSYTFTIYHGENNVKAKIMVGLEDSLLEYFANTIIQNNEVQVVSNIGIEEETPLVDGLIEATNDYGKFYYFKGHVENNYVSFANYLWRIVGINSDGSVKLILNDYTETTANFYTSLDETIENKLDFSQNNIYYILNSWYEENLENYERNLISNRYCLDNSISSNDDINSYYLGKERTTNNTFSYNCLGTSYTSRIGLLSVDEVMMAGGSMYDANTNFYLYLPEKLVSWWTLTPSYSDSSDINIFEVTNDGKISESMGTYFRGVRPVINLVKKTMVLGSGTIDDPYVIK